MKRVAPIASEVQPWRPAAQAATTIDRSQGGLGIGLTVVKQIGPVLAAVMLAGRIGGALTAELGTMNVTEQLDAIKTLKSQLTSIGNASTSSKRSTLGTATAPGVSREARLRSTVA